MSSSRPTCFYRHGTAPELAPTLDLTDPANREASFAVAMPRVNAHTPQQARTDLAAYVETLQAWRAAAGSGSRATAWRPAGAAGGGNPSRRLRRGRTVPRRRPGHGCRRQPAQGRECGPGRGVRGSRRPRPLQHPEQIATLEAALGAAGLTYTSEVFEGRPARLHHVGHVVI